jgi:hypothetical protein
MASAFIGTLTDTTAVLLLLTSKWLENRHLVLSYLKRVQMNKECSCAIIKRKRKLCKKILSQQCCVKEQYTDNKKIL